MQFKNTLQESVDIGVFNINENGALLIRWSHTIDQGDTKSWTPSAPYSPTGKYRINGSNILMGWGFLDAGPDDNITISQNKNTITLTSS